MANMEAERIAAQVTEKYFPIRRSDIRGMSDMDTNQHPRNKAKAAVLEALSLYKEELQNDPGTSFFGLRLEEVIRRLNLYAENQPIAPPSQENK